jgi:hypothetical protein
MSGMCNEGWDFNHMESMSRVEMSRPLSNKALEN